MAAGAVLRLGVNSRRRLDVRRSDQKIKMDQRIFVQFIVRRLDAANRSGLVLAIGGLVALLALALFLSIAEDVVTRDPLVVNPVKVS